LGGWTKPFSIIAVWGVHPHDLVRLRLVAGDCVHAGEVGRIVLTRPAVEAGERLGYPTGLTAFPGSLRSPTGSTRSPRSPCSGLGDGDIVRHPLVADMPTVL
jgi:hypothetical protein